MRKQRRLGGNSLHQSLTTAKKEQTEVEEEELDEQTEAEQALKQEETIERTKNVKERVEYVQEK